MTLEAQAIQATGEVHPAADVFPMLSDQELGELAEDILANGLIYPIVIDGDGRLIDGRNRLAACNLAGVQPRFEILAEGMDPVAYILSTNIARRHLSKGQQAMAAAKLGVLNQDSVRRLAEDTGISRGRIGFASVVLNHAPDLADAVLAGTQGRDVGLAEVERLPSDAKSIAQSLPNRPHERGELRLGLWSSRHGADRGS